MKGIDKLKLHECRHASQIIEPLDKMAVKNQEHTQSFCSINPEYSVIGCLHSGCYRKRDYPVMIYEEFVNPCFLSGTQRTAALYSPKISQGKTCMQADALLPVNE